MEHIRETGRMGRAKRMAWIMLIFVCGATGCGSGVSRPIAQKMLEQIQENMQDETSATQSQTTETETAAAESHDVETQVIETEAAETAIYETETEKTEEELRVEAYQVILDEYICAMEEDDENYKWNSELCDALYPHVAEQAMFNYHAYEAYSFYYCFYDVDSDGRDELLIGYSWEEDYNVDIVDVYGFDGEKAVTCIDNDALGDRARLSIYRNGAIVLNGSNGASTGTYEFFSIAEDGSIGFDAYYDYEYPGESLEAIYTSDDAIIGQEEFDDFFEDYIGYGEEVIYFAWVELK